MISANKTKTVINFTENRLFNDHHAGGKTEHTFVIKKSILELLNFDVQDTFQFISNSIEVENGDIIITFNGAFSSDYKTLLKVIFNVLKSSGLDVNLGKIPLFINDHLISGDYKTVLNLTREL